MRCPGQDSRFWKPDDVYDVKCPRCGGQVEFFKDDLSRKCRKCGTRFKNPHLNMGCAAWCAYAEECIDYLKKTDSELKDSLGGKGVDQAD